MKKTVVSGIVASCFTLATMSWTLPAYAKDVATPDFFVALTQPPVDDELFGNCGKVCPQIEYQFVATHYPWLDDIINKDITQGLWIGEQTPQQKQQWQTFNQTVHPSAVQYTQRLNASIRELITQNKTLIAERGKNFVATYPPLVQVTAKPRYIGHKSLAPQSNLELFATDFYQYTGGAHGLSTTTYYVFDMNNQQQLTLNDVLMPNQRGKLESMAKTQFASQLQSQGIDPNQHFKDWQFYLTDNFSFNQQGLTLLYQPYDIAFYAFGSPKITIGYRQLAGVIKPQYLP